MSKPRITASLRFGGDDLDPQQITDLLHCEPTFARRKGEEVGIGYAPARTGVWSLDLDCSKGDLNIALLQLFSRLPNSSDVWTRLVSNFDADVFCGIFLTCLNQGVILSPNTMQELSRRALKLSFDIYSSPRQEQP